jgi:hypothetical protein
MLPEYNRYESSELDLEKKIGLPSGQKAWEKMCLNLVTIVVINKNEIQQY